MQYLPLVLVLSALALSACKDPRANCNHPQHEEYIRNKGQKGYK